MLRLLRFWFGVTEPVGRLAYGLSGFGLALFKYLAELLLIWVCTGNVLAPAEFLLPLIGPRIELLQPGPEWLGWLLVVWTLPFLWIAISMSVRRAANAGYSPWLGMLVLLPVVNLVVMPLLAALPSAAQATWAPRNTSVPAGVAPASVLLAIGASLLAGGVMLLVSVYVLADYGAALFLGTPLMMGATAAYVINRPQPCSYGAAVGVGTAAVLCGMAALLLFALEGAICVLMALPLMVMLGAMGALIGKAIADASYRPPRDILAAVLMLPLAAGLEGWLFRPVERVVCTVVEIDAPPAVVWRNVIHFPDLPPPDEWYFRAGIAAPLRAHIVGEGVGATRYCEFSTGAFVEPITAWEPAQRLAFDVTEQPAPMFELSPYRDVHPPHLDGYLRSHRGEFRLMALPGNRTRLEGRTWYSVSMFPQWYWNPWSAAIIHRIHERVLRHVRNLSEQADDQRDGSAASAEEMVEQARDIAAEASGLGRGVFR